MGGNCISTCGMVFQNHGTTLLTGMALQHFEKVDRFGWVKVLREIFRFLFLKRERLDQALHLNPPFAQAGKHLRDVGARERIVIHQRPSDGLQGLSVALFTVRVQHNRRVWPYRCRRVK